MNKGVWEETVTPQFGDLKYKWYTVKDPTGAKWVIPVSVIVKHRAEFYVDNAPYMDLKKALEDTISVFNAYQYIIHDWASENMNWDDVKEFALKVKTVEEKPKIDWQNVWVNGEYDTLEEAPETEGAWVNFFN